MFQVVLQGFETLGNVSHSLTTWLIASVIGSAVALLIAVIIWRLSRRRLSRLLDTGRKLRVQNNVGTLFLLLAAAWFLLPNVYPVAIAQQADPQPDVAAQPNVASDTFELRIVGPNGRPVPNAEVEIRPNSDHLWEVRVGAFVNKGTYGRVARANEQGVLVVERPEQEPNSVSFSVFAPGYAPFIARWSHREKSEVLPTSYTANLDAGQSIGGVIVDEQGQPIAGARVHPSVEYKKRVEDNRQLGVGKNYTSDEHGRWRIDVIPASSSTQSVTVTHPDYMPTTAKLNTTDYRVTEGESGSQSIQLSGGITLAGRVTDTDGEPIAGAMVRTRLRNETLEAETNAQGEYMLTRLADGATDVAATADGYGPVAQNVNIRDGVPNVDFVLPVGHTIRVRVTDANGKPLPRTRMFFQRWGDKTSFDDQLGMVFEYTDENGIWEFNRAPSDAMVFDVCPPGSMQIIDQPLRAREEEYHFVATPPLTVHGVVLDADTRKPIKDFHVTTGDRWPGRADPFWHDNESFAGTNGSFEATTGRVDGTRLFRVKASGYAPLTSRDIEWNEGSIEIQFPLKKAENCIVQMLQSDGQPAVDAKAAIGVGDTQIVVKDGNFSSSTFAERIVTDAAGRFNLGAITNPVELIVVHDSGYAAARIDPSQTLEPITLLAWGSIAGRLKVGAAIGSGREVVVNYDYGREGVGELARVRHENQTITDKDGSFRLDHLLPGAATIGINVITHVSRQGLVSASSHHRRVIIEPGKISNIELGGEGHRVIGKLLPPKNVHEPVDWEFSRITIVDHIGVAPPVPYPAELKTDDERRAWFQAWRGSPDSLPWRAAAQTYDEQRRSQVRYMCGVEDDGSFVIDDIPSGAYQFDLQLNEAGKSGGPSLGTLEFAFEVKGDDQQRGVVDLGPLQVE